MEQVKQAAEAVASLFGRKPSGPKIRYAVVAAGNISQKAFMPAVANTTNSVMTVLVTDDSEKYDKLAKQYNLKAFKYDEYEAMLNQDLCDALYIATPNWMHRQFAVPALEKGYHVLLEKPMEVTPEDCEAINAAQRKSGAKLMVAYRLHTEPCTLEVYDRLRKGDLGDLRIFSSVFTQPLDEQNHRAKHGFNGGPIPDMGPYPINAARNAFGLEPTEVFAYGTKTPGRNLNMEHDTITVILKFPGERVAQLTCGYSGALSESYSLVGTKGDIKVEPAYLFGPGVKLGYKTKIEGKEDSKTFPNVDHFAGETDYFSNCILNNLQVEPDGEEGLMDVIVIDAVKRSLESGKTVKLEPRQRSQRTQLDQVRKLTQSSPPSEYIGRDAQEPAKQ
eukprot:TRINITY_DN11130_c0_g1_i1.p1 TRINITY_DN11130_c0_g1~~TRINITY_DN11130_c0_g1_i1.p1  ORF type:complete len:390 (+),score=119.14 TRINITY_DN11130_c0_g1_i1:44-1213(+)